MDFVDNNIQKVQVQPEDQVYARNEDIKVYGKLVSMSTENVVADSEQIWDEALKKNQSDINSQTQSKFGEYLPLTGGDIDGNLNVDGVVGLNGTLTLDDGTNAAHFTPTSIELSMSNDSVDTHVTAKTINTNEVLLRQSKAHGTQTIDTSITPGLIRLHQTPGGATRVTTIQPTGIRSPMFQITDGTDQDVLLGDGSTTNRLIKDVTAGAIQSEYNFNFITTGNVNKFVTINAATSTTAGVMTAADKVKFDDIENTYLPLSGGTLTGTLRLNDLNSDENGLDINNVNGIQSVDQDKVLNPEVWCTDGSSIPLNKVNGIPILNSNGKIEEFQIEDLNKYISTQGGMVHSEYYDKDRNAILKITGNPTKVGSYGSIMLGRTEEYGKLETTIELDGTNGSIEATNATFTDKVKANGFLANNNGNSNTVWTTNGGSIDLINLLKHAAIYVYGGLERVGANVNKTTVIDNPDNIIFSSITRNFLAKKDSVYYTHWNADISKNIASPSRYGIETDNGVFPFNNQIYKFLDEDDLYIATCIDSVCYMDKLTL